MQPIDPYAPPGAGGDPATNALSKVNLPATLIIAAQGVGILVEVASLAFRGAIRAALESYAHSSGKPFPPGAFDGHPVLTVLEILGGGFVVYAMLEMKKLRRFPIAVTGAIFAMLPFTSLCCCFGFPIGIWALVVLFNPDVRARFS